MKDKLNPEAGLQAMKDSIKKTGYEAYNHLNNGHSVNLGPLFGFSPKKSEAGPQAIAQSVWVVWDNMLEQLAQADECLDEIVYGKDPRFNREMRPREHVGLILDGMAKAARQRQEDKHLDVISGLQALSASDEDVDTKARAENVERVRELLSLEE